MTTGRSRTKRRFWAGVTFFASLMCLAYATLIWIRHYAELIRTGHIHHRTLAALIGVKIPALELTLCLVLPLAGVILFYISFSLWASGVYSARKGAADSGPAAAGEGMDDAVADAAEPADASVPVVRP